MPRRGRLATPLFTRYGLAVEAGAGELADDGGVADVAAVADADRGLRELVDVGADHRVAEVPVEHGGVLLLLVRGTCASRFVYSVSFARRRLTVAWPMPAA